MIYYLLWKVILDISKCENRFLYWFVMIYVICVMIGFGYLFFFFFCWWGRLVGFERRRVRGGSDRCYFGMIVKIVIENCYFIIIGIGNGCNCFFIWICYSFGDNFFMVCVDEVCFWYSCFRSCSYGLICYWFWCRGGSGCGIVDRSRIGCGFVDRCSGGCGFIGWYNFLWRIKIWFFGMLKGIKKSLINELVILI